jgi:hypothetical protein
VSAAQVAWWQEYGTDPNQGNGIGIEHMLALTDAFRNFERKLEDRFAGLGSQRLGQGLAAMTDAVY